ncbi:unnamed protein product [Cylindrotheca closterium]|uniref:Uncharacterized protein n=1 Tax=Cylindrotheca closterium TaxID=2856 RepID=A0AAD2G5E6_9STRA|nr:unnamed protein product [Cylindrotheca closterium]
MQKKGMSYLNDPTALVFTGTMRANVNGIIDKSYDVGFIRTNFLESLTARNPNINASAIKVVAFRKDEDTVDEAFPLDRSSADVPEWRFSAAPSTPASISKEVQAVLLALKEHGRVGLIRSACMNLLPCTGMDLLVSSCRLNIVDQGLQSSELFRHQKGALVVPRVPSLGHR